MLREPLCACAAVGIAPRPPALSGALPLKAYSAKVLRVTTAAGAILFCIPFAYSGIERFVEASLLHEKPDEALFSGTFGGFAIEAKPAALFTWPGPTTAAPGHSEVKIANEVLENCNQYVFCREHMTFRCKLCRINTWIRTEWLDFWAARLKRFCHKHRISEGECDTLIEAVKEMRWKIYLAATSLVCLWWLTVHLGRKYKRKYPSYWKNTWKYMATFHEKCDATRDLKQAVQEIFDNTTDRQRMGRGYDGSWQKHKSFEVISVTRIEDARVWKRYVGNKLATPKVTGSSGALSKLEGDQRTKTDRALMLIRERQEAMRVTSAARSFIKSLRLDGSRNEVLLFHGSPGEHARDRKNDFESEMFPEGYSPLAAICECGFDQRLGTAAGMLGSGVYFADRVSKADCYAGKYGGKDDTTVGEEASMFLSRVVLGLPYLAQTPLNGIRRPPCIRGHFDVHLLLEDFTFYLGGTATKLKDFWQDRVARHAAEVMPCHDPRFDTVISDTTIDGERKLFHEYAVYAGSEAYPEFKVTYRRTA